MSAPNPIQWEAPAYVGEGTRVHQVARSSTGEARTACGRDTWAEALLTVDLDVTCWSCLRAGGAR